MTEESVFERLSRKQTAASIGQQVPSRRAQYRDRGASKQPTQFKARKMPNHHHANKPLPTKRSSPQQRRMTTERRLTLLDDLEEVEQSFEEKEEESEELDTELDGLLAEETNVPSPSSPKRSPVSQQDAKATPRKTAENTFERLYNAETKASIGQKCTSPRRSPARPMNGSPSRSPKNRTTQTPTKTSPTKPQNGTHYCITNSKMAVQALAEIRKAATALHIPQLKLISMKESYDSPLLTQFYDDLMIPNFPLEDERDDLEDWVYCLDPANKEQMEAEQGPLMDVLILVGTRSKDNETVVIAGIAFEYYRHAQTGLLSYMVVSDNFRRLGILRSLHPVACQAMQKLHTVSVEKQRKHSSKQFSPKINAIFAETNTLDAGDAPPEVIQKRHSILHKLGYRHLRFPYVQPPLAEDGDSFDDIMLLIHSESAEDTSIDTEILFNYVVDFYQSVTGYDNEKYKKHWYYKLVRWYRKRNPKTDVSMELPWNDVTKDLQLAMEKERKHKESKQSPRANDESLEAEKKKSWTILKEESPTSEQSYWVERAEPVISARNPLPFLSPCSSSDDASTSSSSNLLTPDSPESSYSLNSNNNDLSSILFPTASSGLKGPWKMALSQKAMESGKEEPLYIRSMSNILYNLGTGQSNEIEVAKALIAALFHRDCESGKYSSEQDAQVAEKEGLKHWFIVEKAAESWQLRGVPQKIISKAIIHFDHSKRVVKVKDYQHGVEDELLHSPSQ